MEVSDKSRINTLAFCIFLGNFGVHHFYVGRTFMGILYILTFGLFGIGKLVDIIMLLMGTFRDSEGKLVLKCKTTPEEIFQVKTID